MTNFINHSHVESKMRLTAQMMAKSGYTDKQPDPYLDLVTKFYPKNTFMIWATACWFIKLLFIKIKAAIEMLGRYDPYLISLAEPISESSHWLVSNCLEFQIIIILD